MSVYASCAAEARKILAGWNLPDGWQTLRIADLHELCDPNIAFDEAAQSIVRGKDIPWEDYILFLNTVMEAYDRRYAARHV